ncbi:MAG: methyltransferase domain-containing protein [Thermoproteus sp.]
MGELSAVVKYYDIIADSYKYKYLKMEYYRILYRKIGEVIDRYIRPNMEVLDVGAGTGFWTIYMRSKGAHVVALDLSVRSLKACRCEDRVVGEAAHLPVRAHRFDVITALGSVYNHTARLEEAFRIASFALKEGGLLIADIDNAVSLDMFYEYLLFQGLGRLKEALAEGYVRGEWESADGEIPFYYYTYFKVKSALANAGLKVIEARPIYLFPLLPTRLLQRKFRVKFVEKLDLLAPFAPLATTVIYVAERSARL